jgi:hypothetical protein
MIWIIIATIAAAFGAAFGAVAGAARFRGGQAGSRMALALLLLFFAAGSFAYSAYLDQRHGALAPDHFYNSVFGNIVIVGGLLTSIGGALGALAAYFAVVRR